jgi:hypothetical protein
VELKSEMVIDSNVANEGDGWRGSGANPWHLDSETESIVFLTDESDKPTRVGFSITSGGVHYYLSTLRLAAHETRAIDLRKLRDAQQPDFKKNLIPAGATDGSVNWIRLDNVPVSGRLVVMSRSRRIASSYDCCACPCTDDYCCVSIDPYEIAYLLLGSQLSYWSTAEYDDCNGGQSYYDVTSSSTWSSSNTSVASVSAFGDVSGLAGGSTTISASYSDYTYSYDGQSGCSGTLKPGSAGGTCKVQSPAYLQINFSQCQSYCTHSQSHGISYSVLDQNKLAIQKAGMTITESIYNINNDPQYGGCGGTISDSSSWPTGSLGQMVTADGISHCCATGVTCSDYFDQKFTVNGHPVSILSQDGRTSGSHNHITWTCLSGTGNCAVVTITP